MLPDAVVKGPTPVKTKLKKYTILKGPFKHKKARDQLGIQRYRRKIVIDTTRDVAEKVVGVICLFFLSFTLSFFFFLFFPF